MLKICVRVSIVLVLCVFGKGCLMKINKVFILVLVVFVVVLVVGCGEKFVE